MNWKQAITTLNRPKVMGQLRHFMNTVGAALAMHGAVNEMEWQVYSGLGLAVIAFVGSLMAAEKNDLGQT